MNRPKDTVFSWLWLEHFRTKLARADLARVAEFLAFLKFRNRFRAKSIPNEA